MKHLSLPLVDAYLIVRSRRLSVLIQPNMRLLYNLCGWEIKLAKERAGGDQRKLKKELARTLTWPYLSKEVHALNEKYLHWMIIACNIPSRHCMTTCLQFSHRHLFPLPLSISWRQKTYLPEFKISTRTEPSPLRKVKRGFISFRENRRSPITRCQVCNFFFLFHFEFLQPNHQPRSTTQRIYSRLQLSCTNIIALFVIFFLFFLPVCTLGSLFSLLCHFISSFLSVYLFVSALSFVVDSLSVCVFLLQKNPQGSMLYFLYICFVYLLFFGIVVSQVLSYAFLSILSSNSTWIHPSFLILLVCYFWVFGLLNKLPNSFRIFCGTSSWPVPRSSNGADCEIVRTVMIKSVDNFLAPLCRRWISQKCFDRSSIALFLLSGIKRINRTLCAFHIVSCSWSRGGVCRAGLRRAFDTVYGEICITETNVARNVEATSVYTSFLKMERRPAMDL